jgi:hypothetical protein
VNEKEGASSGAVKEKRNTAGKEDHGEHDDEWSEQAKKGRWRTLAPVSGASPRSTERSGRRCYRS